MFAKNSTLQEDGRGVPRLDMDAAVRIKNLIIKTKEVKNILKNLKLDKAPGPDEIPPVVLKNCSSELSPILARLFRLSIKTSVFPTPWKYGNIHPIPKKGNRSEPSNYRPITLTSTISKTFETIINKHIIKHLENNKLINDRQYGFRSGRSTADLIAYLTHNIHQTIENLGETHAIALDISKAFDRVWHPALLSKLNSYGLSPFSSWISSFLSGRRVRVVLDGLFSDFFSINAGVPQGSVLAPTLFLIHINDLLSDTTSNPIHSYADDSTLHSSIKSKPSNLQDAHDNISRTLNSDLAKVSEWGYKNMVNFNPDKTQYIKFSNRTNHTHPQITFNDTNISPSPSIEILGITLTSTLSWTPQITSIAKAASRKLGLLYRAKHYFSDEQLVTIYKSHVRSQMEYCSHIWAGGPKTQLNHLDRIQNRAISIINNPNITQHIPPLHFRRDVASLSLFYKYYNSTNLEELHSIIPPQQQYLRRTRASGSAHDFTVKIPHCRTAAYQHSFHTPNIQTME